MEEREVTEERVPPYMPYSHFEKFLEIIKGKTPLKIEASFFQMHGYTKAQAYALISGLKYLRVIREDGTPTERFYRLQTKEPDLTQSLKTMVELEYSQLLKTLDLQRISEGVIHNYFLMHERVKASIVSKCTRFFISIAAAAGIPLSQELQDRAESLRATLPSSRRKPRRKAEGAVESAVPTRPERDITLEVARMEAKRKLIEKIPDFDANWTTENIKLVRDMIFALMERLEEKESTTSLEDQSAL